MKRQLILLCCAIALMGQTRVPATAPAPDSLPNIPVQADLQQVFSGLANQLHEADKLVKRLKKTAAERPQDTKQAIEQGAVELSTLADRVAPTGDLAQELMAVRQAAVLHRKRVQDLAKGTIEESDRTIILAGWDHVIQQADKARAAMDDMHGRLMNAVKELRMRETAVSEMMLAGEYNAAIKAVQDWIAELQTTVSSLRSVIDNLVPRPTS